MKKVLKSLFFLLIVFIFHSTTDAQPYKRICVMGSSTAWGYFRDPNPPHNPLYPRDSAWTFKLSVYYKNLGLIDTLFNIAQVSTDPYTGMPSSYVPPGGRNLPDSRYNITNAVNLIPKPDVIIVNYPSNNFDWQTIQEILFCLQTIKDSANAAGIQCYITTTQPRNTFSPAERQKLKDLRDTILSTFGQYGIDFFTDVVQLPSLNILPIYSLGDGIHLNPAGHTVLEQEVINKNVLLNTLPVSFVDFNAVKENKSVKLSWTIASLQGIKSFTVERSANAKDFYKIGAVTASQQRGNNYYQFYDEHPLGDVNYFRISATEIDNQTKSSKIISVLFKDNGLYIGKIFPDPAKDRIFINVNSDGSEPLTFSILNSAGKILRKEKRPAQANMLFSADVQQLPKGAYTLLIQNSLQRESVRFVK
ncbi:MAG: T9SS type A sorting domain-containing protein [Bacteroidota bacterium]|nr:T9SS type A sorting domain-containing protein [Bacteroidota bacterium]